jgi:hypothetical protein
MKRPHSRHFIENVSSSPDPARERSLKRKKKEKKNEKDVQRFRENVLLFLRIREKTLRLNARE